MYSRSGPVEHLPVDARGRTPALAERSGGYEPVMTMGSVHSVEVGSFVDGPGTRFVVFLAGCPMRCQYCQNPDTWCGAVGDPIDSDDLIAKIARTAAFLKAGGGGVTIGGGEPLVQPQFVIDVLRGAKALGLHTALDTSGYLESRVTSEMLDVVDLVLLDIKSYDPATYREVTGVDVAPTLRLAQRLAEACKPVWIRFVLVPGLTDEPGNVKGLARFVAGLPNAQRIDIVPFHQLGRHKWDELRIPYRLHDTEPPSTEQIAAVRDLFADEGVTVGEEHLARC
jgi:pyruvate formate lyase activating enzyme